MAIPAAERKYFEEMGERNVRLQFGVLGFSYPRQNYARDWLAEFDEAQELLDEGRYAELMRMNKSTLKAAWIAAGAAILAVLIGIGAWIFPLH